MILRKIEDYLECMRWKEVLLMSGIPLLGSLFAISTINPSTLLKILMLGFVSFFLGTHVYLVNDWFGFPVNMLSVKNLHRPLVRREISARKGLLLILILLFLSLLICVFLSLKTLLVGVLISINWFVYSRLRISLRAVHLSSFLGHLIGGILLFLLGYSAFHNIDLRSILISIYFSLVLIGGHLNHEVKDYDVDLKAKIITSAVKFGKRKVFFLSFIFFSLSSLYFYLLSLRHIVSPKLGIIALIIYPFYFYFFYSTLRKGISFENICRFRQNYRLLFGIMGFFMGFYLVRSLF